MGAADREELRRRADEQVQRWEVQLTDELERLWVRQEAVVLARLRGTKARKGTRHWDPPGESKVDESYVLSPHRWLLEAAELAERILGRVALYAFLTTVRRLLRTGDDLGEFAVLEGRRDPREMGDDEVLEQLGPMLRQRLDMVARGVETAAQEVRDVIAAGEADGKSMDTIADEVKQTYAQGRKTWSRRIVTTNVVGTLNQAALAGATEAGAGFKQWLSAHDSRVRPTHRHADGQVVRIGDPFVLGGIPEHPRQSTLMFPGDPVAPLEEIINCRCTVLFPLSVPGQYEAGDIGFAAEPDAALVGVKAAGLDLEEKFARRVRTVEGMRRFGLPMGALITADVEVGSASALGRRAAEGGFTFDPKKRRYPKTGFVVAVPGHSHITPVAEWNDEVLANYVESSWEELKRNDDLYLGGWLDKEHGEVVLDLVEVLNDRDEAIRRGVQRNEQAIFDLSTFEEISTGGTGGREELVGAKADALGARQLAVLMRPRKGEAENAFFDRVLDALREAGLDETKAVRRVRTPEGARMYGQPIGSVIVPDGVGAGPIQMRPELGGAVWAFDGGSEPMTAAAAGVLKDPGSFWADDNEFSPQIRGVLDFINSQPPARRSYTSGHREPAGWVAGLKPGDRIVVPLMAATPDERLATAYAGASEPVLWPRQIRAALDEVGDSNPPARNMLLDILKRDFHTGTGSTPVVYEFLPGARSAFYRKNERLVSGDFEVASVRRIPVDGGDDVWDTQTEQWVKPFYTKVQLRYTGKPEQTDLSLDDDVDPKYLEDLEDDFLSPDELDAHEVAYALDAAYAEQFDAWHQNAKGAPYNPPASKVVAKYRSYGGSSLWVYADGHGTARFSGKAGTKEDVTLDAAGVKALLAKGSFKPQPPSHHTGSGKHLPPSLAPHISPTKKHPPLVPPTDVKGLPGVRYSDERSPGGPAITMSDEQLKSAFDLVGITMTPGLKVNVRLVDQKTAGEQGVTWLSGVNQYEVVVKVLPGAWPEPQASLYVINNSLLHELRHVHQSQSDPQGHAHFQADYSKQNMTPGIGYAKNSYELDSRLYGHLADPTGSKALPAGFDSAPGKAAWVLGLGGAA